MLKLCSFNFSRNGRSLSGECDRANAADQDDVAAAAGEPSPVRHQRSCQGRKVPVRQVEQAHPYQHGKSGAGDVNPDSHGR